MKASDKDIIDQMRAGQTNILDEEVDISKYRKDEPVEGNKTKENPEVVHGYIKGYNFKRKHGYLDRGRNKSDDPDKKIMGNTGLNQNSMVTKTEEEFKFLSGSDNEDPLYLTFEIMFLNNKSPLFDSTNKNGVDKFLDVYDSVSDTMRKRKNILREFRKEISSIFYSEMNFGLNGIKNYYIEQIDGLDKIIKPIIKYKDDKIGITMTEDIKMKANYLAELYNNLSYDFKFKREAIPESCLRFDMAIVMSDIRKTKTKLEKVTGSSSEQSGENQDNQSGILREIINRNKYKKIFILRDCSFDFMESSNHKNQLQQGGFDTSKPGESKLTFQIYYKSVERSLFADLYSDPVYPLNSYGLLDLDNEKQNINNKFLNITTRKPSDEGNIIYETRGINIPENQTVKRSTEEEQRDLRERLAAGETDYYNISTEEDKNWFQNVTGKVTNKAQQTAESFKNAVTNIFEDTKDKFVDTTKKHIVNFKNDTLEEFRKERGKLMDSFFSDLQADLGIQSLYPDNVYDPEFGEYDLANFARNLGSELYQNLESTIRGEIEGGFNNIGL